MHEVSERLVVKMAYTCKSSLNGRIGIVLSREDEMLPNGKAIYMINEVGSRCGGRNTPACVA